MANLNLKKKKLYRQCSEISVPKSKIWPKKQQKKHEIPCDEKDPLKEIRRTVIVSLVL